MQWRSFVFKSNSLAFRVIAGYVSFTTDSYLSFTSFIYFLDAFVCFYPSVSFRKQNVVYLQEKKIKIGGWTIVINKSFDIFLVIY